MGNANVRQPERSKRERIARLRKRLAELDPRDDALVSIFKGLLDLLEDEL